MTSGLRTAFPPWPNMAVPDLREKPRRPVTSTFSPALRDVCFQRKSSLLLTFEPRLFGGESHTDHQFSSGVGYSGVTANADVF